MRWTGSAVAAACDVAARTPVAEWSPALCASGIFGAVTHASVGERLTHVAARAGYSESVSAARRLIESGALYVSGAATRDAEVSASHLLHGRWLVLSSRHRDRVRVVDLGG